MIKGILLGVICTFAGALFVTLASGVIVYMRAGDFVGTTVMLLVGIVIYGALYLAAERGA